MLLRGKGLGLVVALAGLLASCDEGDISAPPPVTPHVFVGHIEGSGALVAIVESDETAVAYTCGVGDTLATHTGWFFGLKNGEVGQNIQLVNGPSGLHLDGELHADGGSGVLTLADGSKAGFTVYPARGNAGLYDYEDAANLVGLIRANDGATAGNAVTRLTTTTTSTPVTVTGTTSTTTTTTQPPTTVSFTTVTTTFNVTTTTLTSSNNRVIRRAGPVVVFLMHGMADNLGSVRVGTEDPVACSGPLDRPFNGRCEWGQDFIPGLFGSSNVRAQLSTLDGIDVTGDQFIKDVIRDPARPGFELFDENVGQTLAGDCVADPTQKETYDPKTARHFIAPGPLASSTQLALSLSRGVTPVPPQMAVFTTWRDATRSMAFSGRRITRQIYAALRWYEATYKVTPGVILIGQSFGGLTSRFLLSRPDPATLDADTNREKVTLCPEDLAKMDYIRDRTIYLLTLATPHEGSYLAEWGPTVKDALKSLLSELRQGVANSTAAKVIRAVQLTASGLGLTFSPTLLDDAINFMDGLIPQLDTAAALQDLSLAHMQKFNLGPIAPDHARRTAASPILNAARTLVPVYATLARSPGSDVFDNPDIVKSLGAYSKKRAKVQGWIMETLFVGDLLTRLLVPKGWGDVTVEPYASFRNILDRRARLFDPGATIDQIQQKFGADINAVLRVVSPWFLGRFGRSADAVIAGIQGETKVSLPHVVVPILTDQKWRIGFDGSTIAVPIPAFECKGTRIPIDLDALARILVDTFKTTPDVMTAITGKDLKAVLTAVSVTIQNTDAFANAVAQWFVGKVKELVNVPAECNAAPDNPFDVFAAAELLNWKIVATTGSIPKPAWIGTGEPVSDGEMDADGAVHAASALGFTLGRVPFFFEHNRPDDAGALASWYRITDNPRSERRNHGFQYENDVGLWIHDTFLVPQIGPVAQKDTFSIWIE